jgi:phospholipase A1|tara:strand:+ start:39418 stop:40272 length:855 start_codon:yes stop_codon:yes gene_type:complete
MIFNKKNYIKKLNILIVFLIPLLTSVSNAQKITRAQLSDSLQKLPNFSIHKDNYFITGVPTNTEINSSTADVKYQVSFKQMITRGKLPWETYLFFTYTQKAFWNIYEDSYPFRDINFNPTISLGKPLFNKNAELKGVASVSFEHESNGRDSIFSRSWNRITADFTTVIFKNTTANFELWLPFGYSSNQNLLEYTGLAEVNIEHEIKSNKLYANLMIRKGLNFEGKGTIRSRIYYNPFSSSTSNQYIMLEWYFGQAEGLLDYEKSSSMIRVGYVIKTNEFDFFRQ